MLTPSGPWVADYAENHCALRRDFGTEGQRMLLELRQYRHGNSFDLLVGSDSLRTSRAAPTLAFLPYDAVELQRTRSLEAPGGITGFTGSLSLRPAPDTGDAEAVTGSTVLVQQDDPRRAFSTSPSEWPAEERREREAGVTAIRFLTGFDTPVELQTGPLDAAMAALRTCVDDLLRSRGIDPEATTGGLARAATPINQSSWAQRLMANYPDSALMRGRQARLRIMLTINPEGRVRDCDVLTDIDPAVFRAVACREILRYARFEPALDAAGEPTTGTWETTVIYAIN